MKKKFLYAFLIIIFIPVIGFFVVKIFQLDASEPITTNFIITETEIYTPPKTWTTNKKRKRYVPPHT